MYMHNGLQGALVTDTDDNRDLFKSYLTQYQESLPSRARVQVEQHNRYAAGAEEPLAPFVHRGRQAEERVARRRQGRLFMHGTECASWGDQDGMGSLVATLAQQNPKRLYVFESTAFGYNMWYELCEQAKDATSERLIFVGWWRNEFYRKERTSLEFRTYWDGEPTPEEREWMREIFVEYKYNVQPEQLAWWRWYLAEKVPGSEINLMYQQFPPTANVRLPDVGLEILLAERVNVTYKRAIEQKRSSTATSSACTSSRRARADQRERGAAAHLAGAGGRRALHPGRRPRVRLLRVGGPLRDQHLALLLRPDGAGGRGGHRRLERSRVRMGARAPRRLLPAVHGEPRDGRPGAHGLQRAAEPEALRRRRPGLEQGSRDIYNVVNGIRDYLYKRRTR
jgi:hypothetical protein